MCICEIEGIYGRKLRIYERKLEIETSETENDAFESFTTDGVKTIYFCDIVGVRRGTDNNNFNYGFIRFDTPANITKDFFCENNFIYSKKYGLSEAVEQDLYEYLTTVIEGYKYKDEKLINTQIPERLVQKYGLKKSSFGEQQKLSVEREQALETFIQDKANTNDVHEFFVKMKEVNSFRELYEYWKKMSYDQVDELKEINNIIVDNVEIEKLYGTSKNELKRCLDKWTQV